MLHGMNTLIQLQKFSELTTTASRLPPVPLYTLVVENFLLRTKKENKINGGGRSS